VRTAELRGVDGQEFDLPRAQGVIPASRMKMNGRTRCRRRFTRQHSLARLRFPGAG